MTAPLTPAACDLRGLPFMPLECARLLESDLFALTTGEEFKAALALWCKSWTQVPAASMPNDERLLAKAAGLSLAEWRAVSEMALKGWTLCDDGRLYHPVVAEKALAAWLERIEHRKKSAKGNAARHESFSFDPKAFERDKKDALLHLSRIAPATARDLGFLPQGEEQAPPRKEPAPPRTPPGTDLGSEGRGRGNIPVGAETPDKRAWREAVALLTASGRMKEAAARSFFGKLLRDHKLAPYRLLPSITSADLKGTPDPQAYLRAAARRIATEAVPSGKPAPNVANWSADIWRAALEGYRQSGRWDAETMGPTPDEPGCWAPANVVEDWRAAA